MEWTQPMTGSHRGHERSMTPRQKNAEVVPSYWKDELAADDGRNGEWRNIMQTAIQQRSHLDTGDGVGGRDRVRGSLEVRPSPSHVLLPGEGTKRMEGSGRRSADKELTQGHHLRRGRRSSGSSRASSTRDSFEGEKRDRDKDMVSLERRLHELQRQLTEERQMSRREKITIARLQQELSRSKSKTMMREGYVKEFEHERRLRIEAERRLHEVTIESDACKARLHNLQEDMAKMEDMVRSMVQYKSKIEQLKQEKASLSCSYENSLQKYREHVGKLEHENMVLIGQVQKLESQQSSCFYCKHDLDYRVRQPGLTHDSEKSKLLLERLRSMETENSSLVLENENQRAQYEKCLDEIANQVVQALLTQKSLREECMNLQGRVKDLESHNKQLNIMFQQRMRYASDSLLQSFPNKKLMRSKLNGSTDSKGSGSQDSYHSLPVNPQAYSFLNQSRHGSGNSMHSVDSGDFLLGGDSLYNAAAQPQPSEPPIWLRDKLAARGGMYSPESPESPEGQPREACALDSPSQSGVMTPRSKIQYLLHQSQVGSGGSPSGSVVSSGSRIETEFPATNESPKMKRVDYVQGGSHSRQASQGSMNSVSGLSRGSHSGIETSNMDTNSAGFLSRNSHNTSEIQNVEVVSNNGHMERVRSPKLPIVSSDHTSIGVERGSGSSAGCRYRYVEEFYDNVGQNDGAPCTSLGSGEASRPLPESLLSTSSTSQPDISPGRELMKLTDAFEEKYTANEDGLPEIELRTSEGEDGEMSPRSKHLSIASSVSLDELLEGEACDTEDELTDFDDTPSSPTKVMVDSSDSVRLECSDTESAQIMHTSNEFSSVASDLSVASTVHSRTEVSIDRDFSASPRPMTLKIASLERMLLDAANQKAASEVIPAANQVEQSRLNGASVLTPPTGKKIPPPIPAKPKLSDQISSRRDRHDSSGSSRSVSSTEGSSKRKVKDIKAFFENNLEHGTPCEQTINGVNRLPHNGQNVEFQAGTNSNFSPVVGYCYRDDTPSARFPSIDRASLATPRASSEKHLSAKTTKCEATRDSGIFVNGPFCGNNYDLLPQKQSDFLCVDIGLSSSNKDTRSVEQRLSDSGVECHSPLTSSTSSGSSQPRSSPLMIGQMKETVEPTGVSTGLPPPTGQSIISDSSDDESQSGVLNFVEMWKSRPQVKLPDWDPKKRLEELNIGRKDMPNIQADLREMDALLLKIDVGGTSETSQLSDSPPLRLESEYSDDCNIADTTARTLPSMNISPSNTVMLEEFDKEWEELCKRAKVVTLETSSVDEQSVTESVSLKHDLTPVSVETEFKKDFYRLCRVESHKSLGVRGGHTLSEPNLVSPDTAFRSLLRSLSHEQLRLQHDFIHGCGGHDLDRGHDLEDAGDFTQQIADLSKTVDELQASLTSLDSCGNTGRLLNQSLTDSECSQKYHWFDDIGVLANNGPATQSPDCDSRVDRHYNPAVESSETSHGLAKCNVEVKQQKKSSRKVKRKTKCEVSTEPSRSWGHTSCVDPQTRADLLDTMLASPMDSTDGVNENIVKWMKPRRSGKLGVVRQTTVTRPALDFVSLFVRYGEKEKEALATFDFLNNASCSDLSADASVSESESRENCACGNGLATSGDQIEEKLGQAQSESSLILKVCSSQCDDGSRSDECSGKVSEDSASNLSSVGSLDSRGQVGDFADELLESLDRRLYPSNGLQKYSVMERRSTVSSDTLSSPCDVEDRLSFSDSCCEEFSADENGDLH